MILVFRVTLMRAKELMMKDVAVFGRGSSDPYAILTVGATTYKVGIALFLSLSRSIYVPIFFF